MLPYIWAAFSKFSLLTYKLCARIGSATIQVPAQVSRTIMVIFDPRDLGSCGRGLNANFRFCHVISYNYGHSGQGPEGATLGFTWVTKQLLILSFLSTLLTSIVSRIQSFYWSAWLFTHLNLLSRFPPLSHRESIPTAKRWQIHRLMQPSYDQRRPIRWWVYSQPEFLSQSRNTSVDCERTTRGLLRLPLPQNCLMLPRDCRLLWLYSAQTSVPLEESVWWVSSSAAHCLLVGRLVLSLIMGIQDALSNF